LFLEYYGLAGQKKALTYFCGRSGGVGEEYFGLGAWGLREWVGVVDEGRWGAGEALAGVKALVVLLFFAGVACFQWGRVW